MNTYTNLLCISPCTFYNFNNVLTKIFILNIYPFLILNIFKNIKNVFRPIQSKLIYQIQTSYVFKIEPLNAVTSSIFITRLLIVLITVRVSKFWGCPFRSSRNSVSALNLPPNLQQIDFHFWWSPPTDPARHSLLLCFVCLNKTIFDNSKN